MIAKHSEIYISRTERLFIDSLEDYFNNFVEERCVIVIRTVCAPCTVHTHTPTRTHTTKLMNSSKMSSRLSERNFMDSMWTVLAACTFARDETASAQDYYVSRIVHAPVNIHTVEEKSEHEHAFRDVISILLFVENNFKFTANQQICARSIYFIEVPIESRCEERKKSTNINCLQVRVLYNNNIMSPL